MKKVINITIGGVVFYVEDDAYDELARYLDGIKKHFSKDDDSDEILEDIESSIAEKFLARVGRKDAAVNVSDVENVISEMGSVKDFKDVADEEDYSESRSAGSDGETVKKKLYRDPDDQIVAGVASGLAAYFGVETALVRLLFFVSIFFGGAGVIIYLFFVLFVKEAETTAQKFEMRGERITLKEIEKSVKHGVEKLKKKDLKGGANKFLGFLNGIFKAIGSVFWVLVKIVFALVGLAFIIAGVAGIFALSFGVYWLISGASVPYFDFNPVKFLSTLVDVSWVLYAAIYVMIFVPLIIFFMVGLSLMKRRLVGSVGFLVIGMIFWFSAAGFLTSVVVQNLEKFEYLGEKFEMIERERHNGFTNIDTMEIKQTEFEAKTYLGKSFTIPISEIKNNSAFDRVYTRVPEYCKKNGIEIIGPPVAIYKEWDEDKGETTFMPAYQVAPGIECDGYEVFEVPNSPAVLGIHIGDYYFLPEAHEKVKNYIEDNGIVSGPVIEEYATMPTPDADPRELVTNLWYLIK